MYNILRLSSCHCQFRIERRLGVGVFRRGISLGDNVKEHLREGALILCKYLDSI